MQSSFYSRPFPLDELERLLDQELPLRVLIRFSGVPAESEYHEGQDNREEEERPWCAATSTTGTCINSVPMPSPT